MKKIYVALLLAATIPFFCHAKENRYDQLTSRVMEDITPLPPLEKKQRLAFAFGAGGVRGFAHLGVIKALEEEGVTPDIVVGASAGSIVASLYAAGLTYKEMEAIADQLGEWQAVKDMTISSKGLFQGKSISKKVNDALQGKGQIEQTPIPLGITVTDLNKRKTLLVVKGNCEKDGRRYCCGH